MQKENKGSIDLTRGSIPGGILAFAIPLFLGQLLQQLYNMVDAWVIGNFADNDAFAAVSSTGTVVFLIIGFFSGIATGGGVVISRYFGARDEDNVSKAVHTNFLMGLIASAIGTVAGLILAPHLLVWLGTPDSVMPHALRYLQIYFGGVSTVILYNICMSIMRALGDSIHPLYYLLFSSIVNIGLDLLFYKIPAGCQISHTVQICLCLLCLFHKSDKLSCFLFVLRTGNCEYFTSADRNGVFSTRKLCRGKMQIRIFFPDLIFVTGCQKRHSNISIRKLPRNIRNCHIHIVLTEGLILRQLL